MVSLFAVGDDALFAVCHFLSPVDLLRFELSCKFLLNLCRNPNAIKYLKLPNQRINNFKSSRYSRIKQLEINGDIMQIKMNNNWISTVADLAVHYTDCDILPSFRGLDSFVFHGPSLVRQFMHRINKNAITILELNEVVPSIQLFESISKCWNLQELVLTLDVEGVLDRFIEERRVFNSDRAFNSDLRSYYQNIDQHIASKLYEKRLDELIYFRTTIPITKLPTLFHWILSGTQKNKRLDLHGLLGIG